MENRFPKNVRQIGNVSDTPKIYVEDYVDTFLNQICDQADEEPVGAFLIGHTVKQDGQESVYISGAVCMEQVDKSGTDIRISEETMERGRQECEEYFAGGEIIGWFITLPGHPLLLSGNLIRVHGQRFPAPNTVLIMKDAEDKDELYFAYKYKELMQMSGHYIYYEKNTAMQNYMIAARKKIGVTPSEVVEDAAAKNFRNIVKERFEVQEQKKNSRFLYAASVFLVLVVLIIGVTTINNYDKMRSVQSSLELIRDSVAAGGDEKKPSVETGGTVIAKQDDTQKEEKQNTDAQKTDAEDDAARKDGGSEPQTQTSEVQKDSGQEASGTAGAASTMQEMSEDIYVVEKGDTLARISKKVYGDVGHVDAICRMNGLKDGNLIFIGQKLLLP